jgi:hypothetical protein
MAVIEAVEANLPRYPVANLSSIPPVRPIMAGQSSASASLNTTEHTDWETPRRNSTPTTPNVGIKHLWPNPRLGSFFLREFGGREHPSGEYRLFRNGGEGGIKA